MWHLKACKVSVSLSFLKLNDFFYHISELLLSTLIQGSHKKHFIFAPVQNEGLTEISILHINLLNLSRIKNKMSIFEVYGAFNPCHALTLKMQHLPKFQPIRLLNPDCWNKFTYWMTNSADPDQLASEGFFICQLIWIYTVCKGRVYPGSAGRRLI